MTTILISIIVALTAYVYFSKAKHLKKLRNSIYEIGSYFENGNTRYYIVMEQSHGKFVDSRKLPKAYKRVMPDAAREIIEKSYEDENKVIAALEAYKNKIK
jgi:hypothetical protein